ARIGNPGEQEQARRFERPAPQDDGARLDFALPPRGFINVTDAARQPLAVKVDLVCHRVSDERKCLRVFPEQRLDLAERRVVKRPSLAPVIATGAEMTLGE